MKRRQAEKGGCVTSLVRGAAPSGDRSQGPFFYAEIRSFTVALAAGLSPEDQTIQSMPDVSPTKWHLAHTSWFFETFLLVPYLPGYRLFDERFGYLFNSYYEAVGARHPRLERGLLSRPGVRDIMAYREHVDEAMARLIEIIDQDRSGPSRSLLLLGLHHEQQHQELLLMDIKHVFSVNPLLPAYRPAVPSERRPAPALRWIGFEGGLVEIGHSGETPNCGFAFDNEGPRHRVWLEPFRLASRLVTCGEYLDFMEAGGYRRPEFWLSDGWALARAQNWQAPLYWSGDETGWSVFTLSGLRRLDPAEPVSHVSFYEADALARWSGKRLPTEAEWEIAAAGMKPHGNFADRGLFHPVSAEEGGGLQQIFGDLWEWTGSPYIPYPRYRPAEGAVGEYNGKFMCNQMVLRGGCAVTPPGHIRGTYRNFFPPSARWVFSGIRLAEDC
jgi:ergothioneine biosynthesis protein EgtB